MRGHIDSDPRRQRERIVRLADVEQVEASAARRRSVRRGSIAAMSLCVGMSSNESKSRLSGVAGLSTGSDTSACVAIAERAAAGTSAATATAADLELDAVDAEALVVLDEVALVVLRRVHVRRARVRQQAHQQVVVRRRRPRGVAPAPLERPELRIVRGFAATNAVEAAAVEDDEQVVVAAARDRVRHSVSPARTSVPVRRTVRIACALGIGRIGPPMRQSAAA